MRNTSVTCFFNTFQQILPKAEEISISGYPSEHLLEFLAEACKDFQQKFS